MEINSLTLYELTFQDLMKTKEDMLKFQALYLETKKELDELKESIGQNK